MKANQSNRELFLAVVFSHTAADVAAIDFLTDNPGYCEHELACDRAYEQAYEIAELNAWLHGGKVSDWL